MNVGKKQDGTSRRKDGDCMAGNAAGATPQHTAMTARKEARHG